MEDILPDPFSDSELPKFAYSCIQADQASTKMTDLFDATIHSLYSDDSVFGTVSHYAAQNLFSKNTTDDSLDLELKGLIDSNVFKPYAYGVMSPRERKFSLRSFAIFLERSKDNKAFLKGRLVAGKDFDDPLTKTSRYGDVSSPTISHEIFQVDLRNTLI